MRIDPDSVADTETVHGSAYLLVDDNGRVLLQQRDDPTPPEGYGRWAVPGGGVEPGETPRQAALREAEEEIGVTLEGLRYYRSFTTADSRPRRPGPRFLHVFFAFERQARARLDVREGLDFRYWRPQETASLRMNPNGRAILDAFLASDQYRGHFEPPAPAAAAVIILDRWGRFLLQQRDSDLPPDRQPGRWTLPGGALRPGESPDAAALREFEEETGHLLEELRFYRSFTRAEVPASLVAVQHVYYIDADLELAHLEVNEGQALHYFPPAVLPALDLATWTRPILEAFITSPAYRGLFH